MHNFKLIKLLVVLSTGLLFFFNLCFVSNGRGCIEKFIKAVSDSSNSISSILERESGILTLNHGTEIKRIPKILQSQMLIPGKGNRLHGNNYMIFLETHSSL